MTSHRVDWETLARALAQRADDPLFIVNHDATIQAWNGAMERITGWRYYEVVGRPVLEVLREESASGFLDRALRGETGSFPLAIHSRDSCVLDANLSVQSVGSPRALICAVSDARRRAESTRPWFERQYEIQLGKKEFGRLLRVDIYADKTQRPRRMVGEYCYRALYGRETPCATCPLRERSGSWPRTRARWAGRRWEIITADRAGSHRARLSIFSVPTATVDALVQARVEHLAERGKLSPRERAVLPYLLMGRSLEDIGIILDISVRTVKFHQANILRKLGVDSRVDLMRLLF